MVRSAQNMNNPARPKEGAAGSETAPILLGGGHYCMDHRDARRARGRPVWILECFVEGRLDVDIDHAGWQRFSTGTGVLYRPGTAYRERCPDRKPCLSVAAFFDPGRSPLFDHWRQGPGYRVIEDPGGVLRERLEEIVAGVERRGVGELRAQGSLCELLAVLVCSPQDGNRIRATPEASEREDLVSRARQFMRANVRRPLQVLDVARHVGLTTSGLAHAYRRLAGRAPMEDLRIMRIQAVKALLFRGRHTLEQIAAESGFADAAHLSRTFRRITGLSPREFRHGGRPASR